MTFTRYFQFISYQFYCSCCQFYKQALCFSIYQLTITKSKICQFYSTRWQFQNLPSYQLQSSSINEPFNNFNLELKVCIFYSHLFHPLSLSLCVFCLSKMLALNCELRVCQLLAPSFLTRRASFHSGAKAMTPDWFRTVRNPHSHNHQSHKRKKLGFRQKNVIEIFKQRLMHNYREIVSRNIYVKKKKNPV